MNTIPIENEIQAFRKHLLLNERTIFSAKYGDGKTFFLDEFKKKCADEFIFLTIYPVNYQISDNKEIFEYIKRDILIQMIRDGMINSSFDIPNSMIINFFLKQNGGTLLSDLIEYSTLLGITNSVEFVCAYKGLKSLMGITRSYNAYKQAIHDRDDAKIAELYTQNFFDKKGSLYEIDLITYLIVKNLSWYKNGPGKGKRTVLIIEDLDRLDPAHLFRILNVFSAHLDRYYQCSRGGITEVDGVSMENLPNKFGFDHIISVLDYESTEKIFKHFYGEGANYGGYMDKFISHQPFHYSIQEIAVSYLFKLLEEKCLVKESLIPTFLKKRIKQLSIRNICRILDDYLLLVEDKDDTESLDFDISTCNCLTRFLAIVKSLGIKRTNIAEFLTQEECTFLVYCIGMYWMSDDLIRKEGGFTLGNASFVIEGTRRGRALVDYNFNKFDVISDYSRVQKTQIQEIINKALVHVAL